jgi:hypothetical protein
MNNPPAFPHTVEYKGSDCGGIVSHGGMTLRDYFASDAMKTLLLELKNSTADTANINPIFLHSVDELEISMKPMHVLQSRNLFLIGDVVQLSQNQLLGMPGMGKTFVQEIKSALDRRDLCFGMRIPEWRKVSYDEVASKSYRMAEAMLRAREQT